MIIIYKEFLKNHQILIDFSNKKALTGNKFKNTSNIYEKFTDKHHKFKIIHQYY